APAATVLTPSRKMAWARTVAVVVPSPATSLVLEATSFTICAPMFSKGSFNSISFATVTPSFVIVGEPNFLSSTTFRPFGPSVIFTASASRLIPRRIACRDSSPWTICFAIGPPISCRPLLCRTLPKCPGFHLRGESDSRCLQLSFPFRNPFRTEHGRLLCLPAESLSHSPAASLFQRPQLHPPAASLWLYPE